MRLIFPFLFALPCFAALDYTITTPTTAFGAGTPSRAITITLTGSGTLASDAIFTQSDGGASGTFYQLTAGTGTTLTATATTRILSGQSAGATVQLVYVPANTATGTITITSTASGGLATGPHTLALPIGTATAYVSDQFSGSTNLTSHTPNTGATWVTAFQGGGGTLLTLTGSGGVFYNQAFSANTATSYIIPTAASTAEHDAFATVTNYNATKTYPQLLVDAPNTAALTGYEILVFQTDVFLRKYLNGSSSDFAHLSANIADGSTFTLQISVRTVNSLQYIFFFKTVSGTQTLLNSQPGLDNSSPLSSNFSGILAELATGTPTNTDSVWSNLVGNNADWVPALFTVSPSTIPANHSGNITLSLVGTGTTWTSSTRFTLSGVTGTACAASPCVPTVTNGTHASIVVTTGVGTGTLTITESVTGTAVGTATVATAALSISPTTGPTGTTPTLTLTGSSTVWTQETAAGLLSVSGGTGASIGTPTITTDTAATAVLTVGSGSGTLTITDTSTGATATFTATTATTFPNANVFVSPGACTTSGGAMTCYRGGFYMKFTVTGTTQVLLNVDTTPNSAATSNQMPTVKTVARTALAVAADTSYTTTQFPANNTANTQITAISGLNSGTTYTITIYGLGPDANQSGCYTGTSCYSVFNSIQFDPGATLSAATLRPKRCIFFGDSYLLAVYGSVTSGAYYTYVDYTWSWPPYLSAAANCEFSVFGVGSQGWVRSGDGGYPAVGSSWNNYQSGVPRTFSGIDYVFIAEGNNDHGLSGSTITGNVTSWIGAVRGQLAAAKLFVVPPLNPKPLGGDASGGSITADIAAGVTAAADAQTYLVTMPTDYQNTIFFTGTPATWCTVDGLHPNGPNASKIDGTCEQLIGYSVATAFQAAITAATGAGSFPIQ